MQGAFGALGLMGLAQAGPLSASVAARNRSGKSGRVTLVQINDSHGYLDLHLEWFPGPHGAEYRRAGGYARIASVLKQIRKETKGKVLFLDNGDTFHGTYPVVKSRGEALVDIMNQLRPQAMTAHWDFAYGPKQLQTLASKLTYPVLAMARQDERKARPSRPRWISRGTLAMASMFATARLNSHGSPRTRSAMCGT